MDRFLEDLILAETGKDEAETENAEPPDFGLHYPLWYVLDSWIAYRNHGILPEPGAYNDQDPLLVNDDWGALNARYAWMARNLKTADPLQLPKTANDWMDFA